MNEPQLSAETREDILDLVDPKVPYSHFVRVLEKYTQEVIATALEEQATRHTMLMAGLEAQIEQKAVIRASELVDKARKDEREKVLSVVERLRDKKFPRGERRWCVECGQRIYRELLNQLKGIK